MIEFCGIFFNTKSFTKVIFVLVLNLFNYFAINYVTCLYMITSMIKSMIEIYANENIMY